MEKLILTLVVPGEGSEWCLPCSDAFDTALMKKTLEDILDCKNVQVPVYDFKTHSRLCSPSVAVCVM